MDLEKVKVEIFRTNGQGVNENSRGVRISYPLDFGGSISVTYTTFKTLPENKKHALRELKKYLDKTE